ncbi:MAG: hypothetical protein A4E38_00037 [Methanoregulaceae archaeon PtaB.Bin108]|nr:MAG: hypothetical protein A4E38_00037 [Methanoregulaceae archaeon PtaB.Bin108]
MKQFFNINGDVDLKEFVKSCTAYTGPCSDIPGAPSLAEVICMGLTALRWFFEFVTALEPNPAAEAEFANARAHYLVMLFCISTRLIPSAHYISNHLIEDYRRWGPLGYTLCEGSENSHSVDKSQSRMSSKGSSGAHPGTNAWASILMRRCAMFSMLSSGVHERFASFFHHFPPKFSTPAGIADIADGTVKHIRRIRRIRRGIKFLSFLLALRNRFPEATRKEIMEGWEDFESAPLSKRHHK